MILAAGEREYPVWPRDRVAPPAGAFLMPFAPARPVGPGCQDSGVPLHDHVAATALDPAAQARDHHLYCRLSP